MDFLAQRSRLELSFTILTLGVVSTLALSSGFQCPRRIVPPLPAETALREFQAENGLTVDDVVGPKTFAVLAWAR
jgi:hypothetical protein